MIKQGIIYNKKATNIGDDIQTYAASLLVDNPLYIDRENLHTYDGDPIDTIINGWFMTNHTHWPPSQKINAHFISFHGDQRIINNNHKDYYKNHEPIGCRDTDTLRHFKNIGVEAYFSGCITLTLPKLNTPKTDEIIAIDLLRTNYNTKFRNVIIDKIIPKELKSKITFDTHMVDNLENYSIEERLVRVEERLKRYAGAKLIITSLIHCALPCLAIGTPVLFIDLGFSNRGNRRSRFNGILDLMNTCNHNNIKIPFGGHSRIDKLARIFKLHLFLSKQIGEIPADLIMNPQENPNDYTLLASKIKESISKFLHINSNA